MGGVFAVYGFIVIALNGNLVPKLQFFFGQIIVDILFDGIADTVFKETERFQPFVCDV